jgi:hypothetical protein
MSNTNVPARKAGKSELVEPESAAAALDAMILALPDLESDDLAERSLARVLNATDAVNVFANPELAGFDDLAGHDLVLRDIVGYLPSRFAEGQKYLVYEVLDESTGELVMVASGSPYIAAGALQARSRGMLPAPVRFVALESRSKPGQESHWLVFRQADAIAPSSDRQPEHDPSPYVNDQVKYPHMQDAGQ